MKIRISYQTTQELDTAIQLLKPITKSCKIAKTNTGQYKRAYIETK